MSDTPIYIIIISGEAAIFAKSDKDGKIAAFDSKRDANDDLGLYKARYQSQEVFSCAAEIEYYLNPSILKTTRQELNKAIDSPVPLFFIKIPTKDVGYYGIGFNDYIKKIIDKADISRAEIFRDRYSYDDFLREERKDIQLEVEA